MATKAKDTTSHGKEKKSSSSPSLASPSNIQHNTIFLSHGRKPSPKSSSISTGSPDRIFPSDKPTPNYLKHTQSSARDSNLIHGKKPSGSDIGSPRNTTARRKSLDKSLSQIQPTRTLTRTLSSSSRESAKERVIKPSSPSPKATYHPIKPLSDKAISSPRTDRLTIKHVSQKPSSSVQVGRISSSKTPKAADSGTHIIPKTRILKRTTSNVSSKQIDTKESTSPTSTTTTITTTTTCTDVVEIVGIQTEQEDKAILEQIIQPDALMIEDEEIHFEIPLDHEQKIAIMNIVDQIEPDHLEEVDQKDHESLDATMEIEEHEVAHVPGLQVEDLSDEKTINQIQIEEHNEDGEEKQPEQMNLNEENEEMGESSHVEPKTKEEGGDEDPKEVNEEEMTVKPVITNTKLAEAAEDELETNMSPPPGTENLVLRRQDVNKGKKEAKAYNDVIEETTSKLLVEKRKNKVLALAGAFETVISLQQPESGQGQ